MISRVLSAVFLCLILTDQAAAQQSLIDPIATIEKFESGGQNVKNGQWDSTHTASGYYQITNSTWNSVVAPATGLPTVGPGTSNTNGVMDLSREQQQQGVAALYNAQGWAPYTCPGCNAKLASYINSVGGADAFTPQGSVDPVNGDSFIGQIPLKTPIKSNATVDGVEADVTVMPTPYSDAYKWLSDDVLGKIKGASAKWLVSAVAVMGILLGVTFAWRGVLVASGEERLSRLWVFGIRCLGVWFLMSASTYYMSTLTDIIVTAIPTWISHVVGGGDITSPAANFDAIDLNYWQSALNISEQTPGTFSAIFVGIVLAICYGFLTLVSIAMFCVMFGMTGALAMVAALLPFILWGLAFDRTVRYFDATVGVVVTLFLGLVLVDFVTELYASYVAQAMASLSIGGGAWKMLIQVAGVITKILIVGFLTVIAWYVVQRIGGGGVGIRVAAPWTHAANAVGSVRRAFT